MMNLEKKGNNSLSLFDAFNSMFNDAFAKEMKTDIEETDKEYVLSIEVPGVKKEEIELSFTNDTLTINVKKEDKKEDNKNYITKEISTLEMNRSYYLDDVDENQIEAKLENGILTVNLKKQEKKINNKHQIAIE